MEDCTITDYTQRGLTRRRPQNTRKGTYFCVRRPVINTGKSLRLQDKGAKYSAAGNAKLDIQSDRKICGDPIVAFPDIFWQNHTHSAAVGRRLVALWSLLEKFFAWGSSIFLLYLYSFIVFWLFFLVLWPTFWLCLKITGNFYKAFRWVSNLWNSSLSRNIIFRVYFKY